MRDVAVRAGVSQSTVSHLLNGTRPVHPDTAAAIHRAIEETGYVHDALARSLRTGRSHTVGLAISAISNPYFAELVRHLERDVADAGRTVLLVDTHDRLDRELVAVKQLLRHRPDGIVLAPAGESSPALELLHDKGVPVVLIDRIPTALPPTVDAVGVHNRRPVQDLVSLLSDLGHRSIAMLAGRTGLTTTTERIAGYHAGLDALDGAAAPLVAHAEEDEVATQRALDELFDRGPSPTALIGGNNQATIAAMRWLGEHDLHVPDDISVAGFDDFEWAELFHPRLTVIRQPVPALAQTVGSLLVDRLADPARPGRVVRLQPDLVVRDSTRRIG